MIVHLISSPRTISTALMYSFYNRADFEALDEPLYAYYMSRTGKPHPGADEIMASQSKDVNQVFKNMESSDDGHLFIKNMASHLMDVDIDLYSSFANIILFRDPARIINSFSKVIPVLTLDDLGIKLSHDIYMALDDKNRIAINSDHLLENPEQGLQVICDQLQIPMSPNMLSWPAGPKDIDGVWAKYWYGNVHRSTGFIRKRSEEVELSPAHKKIYSEALPYYTELSKHSII